MLEVLRIENVAVIEKAEIEFSSGLNVLTGETGAGKSIVIDSLGAVLGLRTSKDIVRSGAEKAVVSAVFSGGECGRWCEDNDIDADDEIILQRRISAEGKNQCRVNGSPVSVAQLKELGGLLLDIHGQNDGQRLLNENSHRAYLDGFGGLEKDVQDFSALYRKYKSLKSELEQISMDESEKERKIDSIKFQISELENAHIKPGEIDEKSARRELLRNSVKLTDFVEAAFSALYGDERSDGAVALIKEAAGELRSASRYSDLLSGLSGELEDLGYTAEDLAYRLRDFRDSLDYSPEELDELENRLELLKRLGRKYGGTEENMLNYLERCRNELDEIEFSGERMEKLGKELNELEAVLREKASLLSEKRKGAAERLCERIRAELEGLNMPGVKFCVEISPVREGPGFNACGGDEVVFMMSANAGQKPGKISKIASGGELSRIMLAMKSVLSSEDSVESMVFDEIDTGVSGIAAQRVGEKLCALSRSRQVICVTHLPQIAAMADRHFEISKREKDGNTYTGVKLLDSAGREREIARLTGGDNVTELTLKSASEQIAAAERYKAGLAL